MKAKKIAFTTKDGREVSFKKKPTAVKAGASKLKVMEKRLSAMEKAVMQYNKSVREHQEKRKVEKKGRKVADATSLMKARSGPKKKADVEDSDSN